MVTREVCQLLSCVRLYRRTIACQASLSMEFFREEHWGGQPFPSPGDRPNPGIEPRSPALQLDSLLSEPPGKYHGYQEVRDKFKIRIDIYTLLYVKQITNKDLYSTQNSIQYLEMAYVGKYGLCGKIWPMCVLMNMYN